MVKQPYNLTICSIVRDCAKNLKGNIKRIEQLRSYFLSSEVIIFENDSKDSTKEILNYWKTNYNNVHITCKDYNTERIPSSNKIVNKYFSNSRISKMAFYRNQYISELNKNKFARDYVLVIDLDIKRFSVNDILNCFEIEQEWDCLTAYGTSISNKLKKQYHDTYALCEIGNLNKTQTEKQIRANNKKYARIKTNSPLIHVHSAFGGLALYKWKAIKGIKYICIPNSNDRVEVYCEHYGLHKQMIERNSQLIFINPNLKVKYRNITPEIMIKYLREKLSL